MIGNHALKCIFTTAILFFAIWNSAVKSASYPSILPLPLSDLCSLQLSTLSPQGQAIRIQGTMRITRTEEYYVGDGRLCPNRWFGLALIKWRAISGLCDGCERDVLERDWAFVA
jgi:hypothetical protein